MEKEHLKEKATRGIFWSSIDSFTSQGINLIIGIILARILSPKEFGLIGMLTIFITVSQAFIDSGFSNALIRKRDCTQSDYSTVFYFNLAIGTFLFIILFFSAPAISNFFKENNLKSILRVLAVVLLIDSFNIIQRAILTKRIDFKLQTRISIIAASGAGVLAIAFAYKGFGVWSLVVLTITKQTLNSFLLWYWNKWRPTLVFNFSAFKELFGFGSKLLASGLIDTIYRNIYYLIIGKFFSAHELGYYTRAEQFKTFPSMTFTSIISRVTYPLLSLIQDNTALLREGYRKMIKSVMLVTCVMMLWMAAAAEPLIITLIGEKWRPSIVYLQMLCFIGMLYPLHSLNLNMLNVLGRSDLFFKLEILKKSLAIPTIVIGILFGIKIMIAGMMLNSLIAYYLNSYWSGKFIKYSMKDQVLDILPSLILGVVVSTIVLIIGHFIKTSYLFTLVIQMITGILVTLCICELTRMSNYIYLKKILFAEIHKRIKVNGNKL